MNKGTGPSKAYIKKKSTLEKLDLYFAQQTMTGEEIEELSVALKSMLSNKEVDALCSKCQIVQQKEGKNTNNGEGFNF